MGRTAHGTPALRAIARLYRDRSCQAFVSIHPGESSAQDLGPALDSWAWDVVAGREGEVFIATYQSAKIVRYKPGDGCSDVSRGPLVEEEQYARSPIIALPTPSTPELALTRMS